MVKITLRNKSNPYGFTVMEVLMTTLILLPVLVSVMYMFMQCVELNELARNSSRAVWEIRNKMSEIENTPFSQVKANYDTTTFTVNGLNGTGVTYVDDSQTDIVQVTATYCWREKNGRIIGEDMDLDGQIDAGEDLNANGILDSPAMIHTAFFDS